MNKVFIFIGLLLLTGYTFGQARDGTQEYSQSHIQAPAAVIDLPYAPNVVTAALRYYVADIDKRTKGVLKNYDLSENTLLVRNNGNAADMRFFIGLKDIGNNNESVVYLLLESTFQTYNATGGSKEHTNRFDLEDAKAYLNNLAVAIRPYAANMQLKLQKKDLAKAEEKNKLLLSEGVSLSKQNDDIRNRSNTNENTRKSNDLERQKAHIEQSMLFNKQEQVRQTAEVEKQKAALVLLTTEASNIH